VKKVFSGVEWQSLTRFVGTRFFVFSTKSSKGHLTSQSDNFKSVSMPLCRYVIFT